MATKVTPEAAEAMLNKEKPKKLGLPPELKMEILGPEPETLRTSQGDLHISPMTIGTIGKFMAVSDRLMPVIQNHVMTTAGVNLTKLISEDPEATFKAVALCAGTTPAVIESLMPDEFIRVATKCLVVNLDFFVRTLPMMLGGAELSVHHALQRILAGLGQSSGSSGPATA